MAGSAEILTAIRELANLKQIERGELQELLKDGILAALAKKHGPTVQAEVEIDDNKGAIRIVILKKVVEAVEERSGRADLLAGEPFHHREDLERLIAETGFVHLCHDAPSKERINWL